MMANLTESFHTTQLRRWVDRMQAGDRTSQDELLHCVGDRLQRLAQKMLRSFPRVRQMNDTADVFQNAVMRLLRSLGEVKPDSTRAFFGLAAEQIRRELLDLARRLKSIPAQLASEPDDRQPVVRPADHADHVDIWSALHERVDQLPAEEREVVNLIFYHDWSQAQVAQLFQVTERTVRRWWVTARLRLQQSLLEEW